MTKNQVRRMIRDISIADFQWVIRDAYANPVMVTKNGLMRG